MSDFLKNNGAALASIALAALEGNRSRRALEAGKERRLEAAQRAAEESRKGYERRMESLTNIGPTQATLDATQSAREASARTLGDLDVSQRIQDQAVVDALNRGDRRGAAGLAQLLGGNVSDQLNARMTARKGIAAADQALANVTEQGKARSEQAERFELERLAQAGDAAAANILDTQDALDTAGTNALTNALNTGISTYSALKNVDAGNPGAAKGMRVKAEAGMRYLADEGFRTEGEFNHDTNKKAVVDEESGEKEAELTGNELVFNPKQVSDMENLIEEGDARGLLEFMKELLSEPQFQK